LRSSCCNKKYLFYEGGFIVQRFEGKVALVTGGSSGIGQKAARDFAREGAKVVIADIDGGYQTVELIKDLGGEATFFKCDVSKSAEVESMIDRCVKLYGRLDFAFNNAGIGPDGRNVPLAPIAEYPEDVWDRMININLKGILLCMKYEIKQIINTTSIGVLKPLPGFAGYTASKIGLIGLTETAALECAAYGIRVNSILPGPTMTALTKNMIEAHPELGDLMRKAIPLGRLAEPAEISEAVIWLCSDEASFVTGLAMPIDGGMHVR
jgi:NAD(P)-dependent dehydrogenase (short-subunit alcohol dehydrogenase family)